MFVFPDHAFAFLHINKTGGTAVKAFLREVLTGPEQVVGLNLKDNGHPQVHEHLSAKRQVLGEACDRLAILAIVRDPHARWVSMYTAARRNAQAKKRNLKERARAAAAMPFEQWLVEYPLSPANRALPQQGPQTPYLMLGDPPAVPENLHVLRLEDIDTALPAFLEEVLGVTTDKRIPQKNVSGQGHQTPAIQHYTPALRELVYELDGFVIDTWYPDLAP